MSAPYMPFFIADYLADTAHLSTAEHGAYLLLIMNYWQRGKPLPADDRKLARIARMSDDEWMDAREALSEFFVDVDGEWTHKRIEREITTSHERGRSERLRSYQWVKLRSEVFQRDGFACRYCGAVDMPLECDHIVPLSRGGTNEKRNLATACMPCNRAKSDRTPREMGWSL